MIPHSLHRLIGLGTIFVVSALVHIFHVLIVSYDGMSLVAMSLIANPQHIVRQGGHGKVVGTDDTLIVIGQCNASCLCKKTVLGRHLHPSLIKVECLITAGAPYSQVLDHGMGL